MSHTGVVYHLYDKNDALLYVGMTFGTGEGRLKQHNQRHSWTDEVAYVVTSEPMPYADLYRAEAIAIQAGQPRHNSVGLNGETQAEWLQIRAAEWRERIMAERAA